MRTLLNRKIVPMIAVVAALLFGVAAFMVSDSSVASRPPLESKKFADHVAYYTKEVSEYGGKTAYVHLAQTVHALPLTVQHNQAHAFGEALYKVEGDKGLAVCDARFQFGCFHQFLSDVIDTSGLATIGALNRACKDALGPSFLSCQHGIGHGVLSAVGYGEEDLKKALEVCKDIADGEEVGGCYGGAFMEYNTRTMWGDDAVVRPGDDAWRPCSILPSEFLRACVYWQPQWWFERTYHPGEAPDPKKVFGDMGKYCDTYTGNIRTSCFGGIGNQIPISYQPYTLEGGIASCEYAARTDEDFEFCINTQANGVGVSMTVEKALEMCSLVTRKGFDHDRCDQFARNQYNTMNIQGFNTGKETP